MKKIFLSAALPALFALLAGCSATVTRAPDVNTTVSRTRLPKQEAPLLKNLKTDTPANGRSAFCPLADPRDAFAARLYLVDHATVSLDVQYYIYEDDQTGNYFADRLYAAAERGVHVRILIDDLVTTGRDREWKMLAAHPNIELRVFNPNGYRRFFRYMALLLDVGRLGKRMHNKSLIADGAAAIVGGRNIGDVYYAANDDTFFVDYDILATGAVVPEIYTMFDDYWNSEWAVPSSEVLEARYDAAELAAAEKTMHRLAAAFETSEIFRAVRRSKFARELETGSLVLTVADAQFYYDDPAKVRSDESDTRTHITSRLDRDVGHVDEELIIISPYFIPSAQMLEAVRELREKNVRVIVITNSLASTDVFAVYSGYIKTLRPLLAAGVRLYEIRPNSFDRFRASEKWLRSHRTSLHTKMMIFDGERLGIGSANLDPRSFKLNTETFMVIRSRKLAESERDLLVRELTGEDLYRVEWRPYPYDPLYGYERSGPVWIVSGPDGNETVHYRPPEAGFWRTFGMNVLTYFPIDGYL